MPHPFGGWGEPNTRGSQVVRRVSAKDLLGGSIPPLASNLIIKMNKYHNSPKRKYSVTLFDRKNRNGHEIERVQIAWRPDWQTSHALLFENPNHINLIPQLLEEAGYIKQKRSVF